MQYQDYCIWVKFCECREEWHGLLPIFGPRSRPRNDVATGWAWRSCSSVRDKVLVCARHGPNSSVCRHTFWCRDLVWKIGVATHFLMLGHGLASLGSRPEIGVTTRPGQGRPFVCRDTALGVAIGQEGMRA